MTAARSTSSMWRRRQHRAWRRTVRSTTCIFDRGATSGDQGADDNASDIDLMISLSTDLYGGNDDIDSGSGDDISSGRPAMRNYVDMPARRQHRHRRPRRHRCTTAAVDKNADELQRPADHRRAGSETHHRFGDGGSDDHHHAALAMTSCSAGITTAASVIPADGSTVEVVNAVAEATTSFSATTVRSTTCASDAERPRASRGADVDASDMRPDHRACRPDAMRRDDMDHRRRQRHRHRRPFGDTIDGGNGQNIVLGDSGQLVAADNDLASPWATRRFSIALVTTALDPEAYADGGGDTVTTGEGNDLVIGGAGGDTVHGGNGNDLVFGDQGEVRAAVGKVVDTTAFPLVEDGGITFLTLNETALDGSGDDLIYGEAGDDMLMGQQGNDILYGGDDDDDLIGGHNVMGGLDAGDSIDGGTGNDVIAGDNATILRQDDLRNTRDRVLQGTQIYGTTPGSTVNGVFVEGNDGKALVTVDRQLDPTGAKQRVITLLDHVGNDGLVTADGLATTPVDRYGNDYLAGGADNDLIFGQLGDDVIQGDGSIGAVQADGSIERTVGASCAEGEGQAPSVMVSVEAVTDGDDYIEGNGGGDVIFGNLGQDDIVGGSSDLFGLVARSQRPDGRDILFGGAGTEIAQRSGKRGWRGRRGRRPACATPTRSPATTPTSTGSSASPTTMWWRSPSPWVPVPWRAARSRPTTAS